MGMLRLKRMDLIDPFTGSKRSQDKKMVQLKENFGQNPRDISAIGEITAKKDSVFNSIKMVTNMKVCGLWIKSMAKVHFGEMKTPNFEESTQVIGLKTKSMEEVHSFLKTQIDTMVTG